MAPLRPGGQELTRQVLDLAALPPGSRLLDIGCGRGESLRLAREEYALNCAGLEPDGEHLAAARELEPGADIRQYTAENMPFADNSFDAALAECSFSLFTDAAAALAQIKRVLRPGGLLLLTDVYAKSGPPCLGAGLLRQIYTLPQIEAFLAGADLSVYHSEDCGPMLKWLLGQLILDHGVEEAWRRIGIRPCAAAASGIGYFFIAARRGH